MMTNAYIHERAFRTINHLTLSQDDLRTRLAEAWDEGFGTIGELELKSYVEQDLFNLFKSIKARFTARAIFLESSAELSIREMSDRKIQSVASDVVSFYSYLEDIYYQETQK